MNIRPCQRRGYTSCPSVNRVQILPFPDSQRSVLRSLDNPISQEEIKLILSRRMTLSLLLRLLPSYPAGTEPESVPHGPKAIRLDSLESKGAADTDPAASKSAFAIKAPITTIGALRT